MRLGHNDSLLVKTCWDCVVSCRSSDSFLTSQPDSAKSLTAELSMQKAIADGVMLTPGLVFACEPGGRLASLCCRTEWHCWCNLVMPGSTITWILHWLVLTHCVQPYKTHVFFCLQILGFVAVKAFSVSAAQLIQYSSVVKHSTQSLYLLSWWHASRRRV